VVEVGLHGEPATAAERLLVVLGTSTEAHVQLEGAAVGRVGDLPRDAEYLGDGFAMAFRKQDGALRDAFDKALAEAVADRTYEKISRKYFTFPIL